MTQAWSPPLADAVAVHGRHGEGRAVFSSDRAFRFALSRRWSEGATLGFLMLNPSTADESVVDPTIRRCIGFAQREGYGAIVVTNLFAYRATKPEDMRAQVDPDGPGNDEAIVSAARDLTEATVCAWGKHGSYRGRSRRVLQVLADEGLTARLLRLGPTNKDGSPRHPLYLAGITPLIPLD